MVVIKGEVRLKAESRDAAVGALPALLAATRAEPGCGAYLFLPDLDDPNLVHVFEEWADEAALEAHMGSAHIAEFMAATAGAVEGATFTRYDVTGSRPLMG